MRHKRRPRLCNPFRWTNCGTAWTYFVVPVAQILIYPALPDLIHTNRRHSLQWSEGQGFIWSRACEVRRGIASRQIEPPGSGNQNRPGRRQGSNPRRRTGLARRRSSLSQAPKGDTGATGAVSLPAHKGKPRSRPDLSEIVAAVVKHFCVAPKLIR